MIILLKGTPQGEAPLPGDAYEVSANEESGNVSEEAVLAFELECQTFSRNITAVEDEMAQAFEQMDLLLVKHQESLPNNKAQTIQDLAQLEHSLSQLQLRLDGISLPRDAPNSPEPNMGARQHRRSLSEKLESVIQSVEMIRVSLV
jgi:hypothetical protein